MCGILGIATTVGRPIQISDESIVRLRDLMEHRGPDGAGLWRRRNVALAHRRLAVIDLSSAGAQPMLTAADPDTGESRFAIVYNGELYNDLELRRELGARGVRFRSSCDTETVLQSFATWGVEALQRLRGIFSLAVYDSRLETLTLARDPLGVKPLYYWQDARQLVFASEIRPILAHPDVLAAPNPRMVSAYLTTIRTVLGEETLFQGVRSVAPGAMLQCDLSGSVIQTRAVRYWSGPRSGAIRADGAQAAAAVRTAVEDSVERQMRSDVPMCTLLSGGLDSTIIARLARMRSSELRSFCAGSPLPVDCSEDRTRSDLECARTVAEALDTRHAEAHVTREVFAERWPRMISRTGLPLSTPNEVAIHAVALRLREDGCIVTLSGEGADELFAGYEGPLDMADQFVRSARSDMSPGMFEVTAHAWVPPDFKTGLFNDRAWDSAEQDRWLFETYDREFAAAAEECGSAGLCAHLRLHRRINLTGLLARLDSATMLAGVEGRTPYADSEIAALAESLPMAVKYRSELDASSAENAAEGSAGGLATATRTRVRSRTKMALREAFAGEIPGIALERPKASFPLPFQQWVGDHAEALRRSNLAREIFTGPALDAVATQPQKLWHLAWPMTNIALWGEAMGW